MDTPLSNFAPNLEVGQTYYLYITGDNLDKNQIYLNNSACTWVNGTSRTITQADLDGDMIFYGGYNTITTLKIMFTSTLDSNYEPYVGGIASPNPDYPQEVQTVTGRQVVEVTGGDGESAEYEINLGKNLFDKDNANVFSGYVGGGAIIYNAYNRILFIPCDGGTEYTIQKTKTHRFEVFYTEETPAIGTQIYSLANGPTGDIDGASSSLTYTTGTKAKFLCAIFRQTAQDAALTEGQVLATVQIEKGSTATSYAPYFDPIELCKIGNYQDRIYKSGGEWYLRKETEKYTFTGDEPFGTAGEAGAGYYGYWRNLARQGVDLAGYTSVYMTHFRQRAHGYNVQETCCMFNGATGNVSIVIVVDSLSTVGAFKTWLANNDVALYYVLATPTDTQITNAALVAQLEALAHGESYNPATSISVESGNLPAPLSVKAFRMTLAGIVEAVKIALKED